MNVNFRNLICASAFISLLGTIVVKVLISVNIEFFGLLLIGDTLLVVIKSHTILKRVHNSWNLVIIVSGLYMNLFMLETRCWVYTRNIW